MASFSTLKLTASGVKLIHQLIAAGGEPLVFTRMGLGDGELADESTVPEMTALISERIRVNIETLDHDADSPSSFITARISSSDLQEDLQHRELGVYALDQEENEILFAYGYTGKKYDYIPATGTNTAITKLIKTFISFAPLDTLYKDLPSDLFVTYTAFESRISQILPGMVSDTVQQAFSERGNVALTDKNNVFSESNTFTRPLAVADAVDDRYAANSFEVRGMSTFMAGTTPSYGWNVISDTPYLIQNQKITGTPRDLYMFLTYPTIYSGRSAASRRIVNQSAYEGVSGFYSYALPHVAFFPFTSQSDPQLRFSISRAIKPSEELPENDDIPCFPPVTGPENAIGKFWVEIILPNEGVVYTDDPVLGRVREGRVKLNYIGDDKTTPVLETYPVKIPTETVYNLVIPRGFVVTRDPESVAFANRKTRVYLLTAGSHQITRIPNNRTRAFLIAEFRAWEHYMPHFWYLSLYQDGSPHNFDRYEKALVLEQPRFFADSSFSAWMQNRSIDIRDN